MDVRTRGTYPLEHRELVAEGSDLRVQVLTLAEDQCVPWHFHSEITDYFVGLEGVTRIETRDPDQTICLKPGERTAVAPKTAHRVSGQDDQRCKVMVIQGVGVYDYIAAEG